ncbi:ATP-binding cassette domain-containing protein [Saccharomonospora iraqiensis]|uniref:ATP-binding cassette domain-containing protein n=1 Tax=Saccharomonospora iraqiensis TaxID=52698 RepID=UPI00022DF0F2|nr:ATP-binding cassette domain-containing protein [Saccharomonospora iraqiensis]
MTGPLLTLSGVRRFDRPGADGRDGTPSGGETLSVVDLRLDPGELVALTGPSGSGKSTVLMVAGGWAVPDRGTVTLHPPLPPVDVRELSWRHLAFVPQSLGLLDELTLAENIVLGLPARERGGHETVSTVLDALDLREPAHRPAAHTSRGEQQRAALGRALAGGAALLLADEPTSHQDRRRADLVCAALRRAAEAGTGVLVATHDPLVVAHADREIALT